MYKSLPPIPSCVSSMRHYSTLKKLNRSYFTRGLRFIFQCWMTKLLQSPDEVEQAITNLHQNKAAGCDGIPPGILKLLNVQWIVLLTIVINLVFDAAYPVAWAMSMCLIFSRKGSDFYPRTTGVSAFYVPLPKCMTQFSALGLSFGRGQSRSVHKRGEAARSGIFLRNLNNPYNCKPFSTLTLHFVCRVQLLVNPCYQWHMFMSWMTILILYAYFILRIWFKNCLI